MCSVKKVFLEISQNSLETTVFSCEFCLRQRWNTTFLQNILQDINLVDSKQTILISGIHDFKHAISLNLINFNGLFECPEGQLQAT